MLPSDFLRQPGFHEFVGLLDVVLPLLAAEPVDFLDQHPLVTGNVRRGTHSRRVCYFVKLLVPHLERHRQWTIQTGHTKHLSGDGETQVVAPFDIFSNRRQRPAQFTQGLYIHLSIIYCLLAAALLAAKYSWDSSSIAPARTS